MRACAFLFLVYLIEGILHLLQYFVIDKRLRALPAYRFQHHVYFLSVERVDHRLDELQISEMAEALPYRAAAGPASQPGVHDAKMQVSQPAVYRVSVRVVQLGMLYLDRRHLLDELRRHESEFDAFY